ncbi:hypothetical protein JW921_00970 [Candidatus Fermentibacterales bacterium]|nr:hypothetical protein [Candidatus Fermentibacterales bacterium]
MAIEERRHGEIFSEILSRLEWASSDSPAPQGELRRWVSLFSAHRLRHEIDRISGVRDALEFAARREMDTIMFYGGLIRALEEPEDRRRVEHVLEEERGHFRRVNELLGQLETPSSS